MNQKDCFRLLFSCVLGVIAAISSSFADSTDAFKEVIREDVFAATTADEFKATFSKSDDAASKIAVLNALPMAINKYTATITEASVPSWLETLLSSAMQDKDTRVVLAAIDQISKNNLVYFVDPLISMYGNATLITNDKSLIAVKTGLINALGSLGTSKSMVLFGKILDLHQVRPETEAALNAIGSTCATILVPSINGYVTDLEKKIQNGDFKTRSPSTTFFISPEGSLAHAYQVIRMLGSNNCGK